MNKRPIVPVLILALAASTALVACFAPLVDGDIWFHLQYARYFLEHHTLVPDHGIYSWMPQETDKVYCSWLSELILYGIFKLAGVRGLYLFRLACMFFFLIAALAFARGRRVAGEPDVALLLLVGVILGFMGVNAKPEVFSFLGMCLLCLTWWGLRSTPSRWRLCYLFPLIMLVWVNSHGGLVFGYVFLLLITVGEWLNQRTGLPSLPPRTARHFHLAMGLCLLVLFATPHGHHYPVYLYHRFFPDETNLRLNSHVTAFLSPFEARGIPLGFSLPADVLLLLILLTAWPLLRQRRVEWSFLLTNAAFALLFTFYLRTTFFWAPVAVFSLIHLRAQRRGVLVRGPALLRAAAVPCMLATALGFSGKFLYDSIYHPPIYRAFGLGCNIMSPIAEAEYIARHYPGKRLGNTYNAGSYLIWRLWPDNKVMIDSRFFPYRAWVEDFFAFAARPEHSDFMQRHPADIWVVSMVRQELNRWFSRSPHWRLAFFANSAAVWVRDSLPPPPPSPPRERLSALQALRNPHHINQVFIFSLDNRQWDAAEALIQRMREIPLAPELAYLPEAAEAFKAAHQAYWKGDYAAAVRHLTTYFNGHAGYHNTRMLAFSYLHLAARARKAGNEDRAAALVRCAHAALPSIYSALYLGMRQGLAAWRSGQAGRVGPRAPWRDLLGLFLDSTADLPAMKPYRRMARDMLAGRNIGALSRPPLLLPPRRAL